jgi:predicted RNase H-like HicB family nuclease
MSIAEYILLPYGYTVRLAAGEDGYVIASCPQLRGCHAQGETVDSALSNIEDAVIGYLALLEEEHATIPPADASDVVSSSEEDATDEIVWAVA